MYFNINLNKFKILYIFNTLRATAAPATKGRPTKARTNGKATTDLEFGQTWDEFGTKLGCNERPKRRQDSPKIL